jgi:hypothetical protein
MTPTIRSFRVQATFAGTCEVDLTDKVRSSRLQINSESGRPLQAGARIGSALYRSLKLEATTSGLLRSTNRNYSWIQRKSVCISDQHRDREEGRTTNWSCFSGPTERKQGHSASTRCRNGLLVAQGNRNRFRQNSLANIPLIQRSHQMTSPKLTQVPNARLKDGRSH